MKRVRDFHSQSWDNPFFDRTGVSPRLTIFRSIVFVLIVAGIIYILVYSPLLRIGKVTVSGASSMDPVKIEAAASQTLGGYDYFIIPKDHFFAINAVGVRNFVMAQFPNLLSVDIKKKFERLDVAVVERQPTYRLIIGDRSYLLDQEGKGMREAASGEGDALIALSNNSVDFAPGKRIIQPSWLQAVIDLHKYFATLVGIRDQLFKLDAVNNDLEVVTVEGWSAIFDPESDIKLQLQTLSSALAGKFDSESRKRILYIDARFGDKVYFKTK
jgi:hypothetical protein